MLVSGSALLRKQKTQSRKIFSFFRTPTRFLKELKIFLFCELPSDSAEPHGQNYDKSVAHLRGASFSQTFLIK
jgi:hypothetical protein